MNKKNAGFSLVELIVVIAIMAVLVGVLAPAYLRYVEKSRKSADATAIDEILKGADAIVSDTTIEFNGNFVIDVATGTATLKVGTATAAVEDVYADDAAAVKEWAETAGIKDGTYTARSKDFKKLSGTATGTFNTKGYITWEADTDNDRDFFGALAAYSSDIGKKLNNGGTETTPTAGEPPAGED